MSGLASWQGNIPLVTSKQLVSSVAGIYDDIQDIGISSITVGDLKVSTLTVKTWISAPTLYVSTIYAENIDISGIFFDASGLLYVPAISSQTGIFQTITNVSTYQMTFKPTFTGAINVTFDLGLGQAIGGIAAGLGAAVGGGLIGLGTGLGLTIQGAEQGIATIIAGRPQNFITTNTYETINFTSQLQVSTLGDASPYYSSIFRTVSSSSANSVPGREIFTSTIFYPGQICIRSASDPINLITGDSNLNTSTIQSFGQWTPLEGLEPENIVATSVSTVNLEAGIAEIITLQGFNCLFSNVGIGNSLSMNYQAEALFETGTTNQGAIVGNLNRLYFQTTNGFIYSGVGTTVENASLYLGSGVNESLFNVSTINSVGDIKTVNLYASTITTEQLNVISTIFLTSTNIEIITSTQTLVADNIFGTNVSIANLISSINFTTGLGNPFGSFDINKTDSIVSTTYNSVSSLTQNILNYTLNAKIQEETIFSAWSPTVEIYTVAPTNVSQWASTMLYCNPGADIGGELAITYPSSFYLANLTGTFDLTVDMTTNPFSMSAVQYATASPGGGDLKSFFFQSPSTGFFQTYRFTVDSNGNCSMITPAPPPYETENSNIFSIYQDINDTYITATDRLHIEAGDIVLEGTLSLANTNIDTLNVNAINTTYLSPFIQQVSGTTNMIEVLYASDLGYVSSLASTNSQLLSNVYINNYVSQISTSVNRPVLTQSFGTGNTLTLGAFGSLAINDVADPTRNWAFGTFVFSAPDALTIQLNNYGTTAVNGRVLNLSNAGSVPANLTIQGIPGTTSIPPGIGATLNWNQTIYLPAQPFVAWPPYVITDDFQINQTFGTTQFDTSIANFTGGLTVASNVVVDGTSRLVGQITTLVPSAGYTAIEIVSYNDSMIWSFVGGSTNTWESAAQNLIPRPAGGYYKSSDWTAVVSPTTWTTPDFTTQLNGWASYTVNQAVGPDQYLALYRLLTIIHIGPPSPGNFNVQIIMFPKNFTA